MKPFSKTDVFSYWLVLLLIFMLVSLSKCVKAQEIQTKCLVSVEWLEKNLHSLNFLLLDASAEKNYSENHIPGAVNVNVFMFGVMETPIPMMEKLFQSIGIDTGKTIVIYDQGDAMLAARMFYSLYYHGFPEEKLFLLDGGLSKWKEKELTVTEETSRPVHGNFIIKKRNEIVRSMLDEFLTASGNTKNNSLIEALDPEMHYGETQFFDRGGHIPNAICMPINDFLNEDKTFKSRGDISKILQYYGIDAQQKILTHCGGGVAAAVPFFVLKFIMGFDQVKLFMESQMGWLKDQRNLPYWTYDDPNLIRGSDWTQTWGGNMMRKYGFSTVSIIDVRRPSEFILGHLPFSVNIPGDILKQYISKPYELSEVLGKKGVNFSHEAVIVSGAGITKDAALAFVLIEMLGQKQISLFSDSMDKFTSFGYKLASDTANLSPLSYLPGNPKDIFISEKTNKGIFDDVFISSGVGVSGREFDGNNLHLYYRDFLTDDGLPKQAKEIWGIMKNAGVPRYARIICFSEDAGESAVNYFIFKLMGYPDVKIKLN